MHGLRYVWSADDGERALDLVFVEGTRGEPYTFGAGADERAIDVPGFFIATVPVTQAFWTHVAGDNPAARHGADLPLENVSWDDVTRQGGFLDRLNASPVHHALSAQAPGAKGRFRLPTEAEWEYAARGGRRWRDGFRFSGSDTIDDVAWYDRRHGDHTQPVAQKAANQLGLFDMSGNVWEWCQDVFTEDVSAIPSDGRAFGGPGEDRVLRGGCFHNWAIHCTVWKRYAIAHASHDGCIGFRLAFA